VTAFGDLPYYALLAATILLVAVLRSNRLRVIGLLASSWIFFAVTGGGAFILLLATTIVDWRLGLAIAREGDARKRRALLVAGLVASLGTLVLVKYAGFFVRSLAIATGLPPEGVALPFDGLLPTLAISFYTFESVSYLVDVYRRELEPSTSFVEYATFIAFFPHLVAGPIVRPKQFLHQIHERIAFRSSNLAPGLSLIALGLVEKLVVADGLAPFVDAVFLKPGAWELSSAWVFLGVLAFGVQIYCDFAGYTHIALGSAKLLNLDLPENFDFPYLATSPRAFWRRWHITLSTWLRDYLYKPLGGSRNGSGRTVFALMATMALGGLWHGASWTFVLWGVLHGALLVADRFGSPALRARTSFVPRGLALAAGWFATQYAVFLGWLLFRAASLEDALYMARKYLFLDGFAWSLDGAPAGADLATAAPLIVGFVVVGLASAGLGGLAARLGAVRPAPWAAAMGALLLAVFALAPSDTVPFIYFQF